MRIIMITMILLVIMSAQVESGIKHTQKSVNIEKMLGMSIHNLKSLNVTITSYNPTKRQCDSSPFYGPKGELVTPGIVAISKDLREAGIKHGDKVILEGYGVFTVADSMHHRWRRKVDIISLIPGYSKKFGVRKGIIHFNRRNHDIGPKVCNRI
jgi:3D (Asp-Asp-Asp) domain-containing protein